MKIFFVLTALIIVFSTNFSFAADKIKYGRDINGSRIIEKIGDEKVKYGYDYKGNYLWCWFLFYPLFSQHQIVG